MGIGGRDQGHEIYKYRQIISEGIIEAQPLPPKQYPLQYRAVRLKREMGKTQFEKRLIENEKGGSKD